MDRDIVSSWELVTTNVSVAGRLEKVTFMGPNDYLQRMKGRCAKVATDACAQAWNVIYPTAVQDAYADLVSIGRTIERLLCRVTCIFSFSAHYDLQEPGGRDYQGMTYNKPHFSLCFKRHARLKIQIFSTMSKPTQVAIELHLLTLLLNPTLIRQRK
ncbi:uncharacterized protein PHA67_009881 isoform 1-T2 [Liasis olivaceus]